MNRKTIVTGLIVVSLSLASTAFADAGNSYAGFSLGNATPDSSGFDNASGWKIFGGYEINDNFAVEGGYTSFGKMNGPVILGFSTSVEPTGFEVAAVGNFPVNNLFTFFGKAGILIWDFKVNVDGLGSSSTTGTDAFFGIGGKFNVAKNTDIQVAWDSYTVEGGGIDLLSVGVVYSF